MVFCEGRAAYRPPITAVIPQRLSTTLGTLPTLILTRSVSRAAKTAQGTTSLLARWRAGGGAECEDLWRKAYVGYRSLYADNIVKLSELDRVRLVTNLLTILVAGNQTQAVGSVGQT